MKFEEFLIEAKKSKKIKPKHKDGKGLDRVITQIQARIDALHDNWEQEEFDKEIQPKLDKFGDLNKLDPRDAVKLFFAITRCYFIAKYPTSTDALVGTVKVIKDSNVDKMLRQLAKDVAEYAQKKFPDNKELDELLTDFEYGYIDDINTEALIELIEQIIGFIG